MEQRLRDWQVRRAHGEQGFTLVELLIVVVILLILAAIAIPIYLGQQDNARRSSVKSALQSVQNQLAADSIEKALTTAAINSAITSAGYSTSTAKGQVVFSAPAATDVTSTGYKIKAGFSKDGTTIEYKFNVDQSGKISENW
ncbi:prepilin-type N-terminal cleavage/methylation domain-containing protein [Pseudoclavibacter sp. CFCC 13796]|nr:prepilin-type N-terminal cleavage/methylation domain-containing protein [Pseudoclavibacter sp. CFCC 13796]